MTSDDHVQTIASFGFTIRQARFLVTVMRHAGVCLQRQYARLAGIVQGQKTRAFFAKLVDRGYASAYACRHNRGRLYHVHSYALYAAIGAPNSRYRRPVSAGSVIERLMVLDTVIASPERTWLATRVEKLSYFTSPSLSMPVDRLPYGSVTAASKVENAFPDTLPIGSDASGRVVLLYLAGRGEYDDLPAFLRRHGELLRHLPAWTLRLVFPRALERLYDVYQRILCEELESPLHPRVLEDLVSYFEQVRLTVPPRSQPTDERFLRSAQAFGGPRFHRLYQDWLRGGRDALERTSSTVIADALQAGGGRIECLVLPHRYDHLAPVVDRVDGRTQEAERGAEKPHEEGEDTPARPQPPALTSASNAFNVEPTSTRVVSAS